MRCHTNHPIVLRPSPGGFGEIGRRQPVHGDMDLVGDPAEQLDQQLANVHRTSFAPGGGEHLVYPIAHDVVVGGCTVHPGDDDGRAAAGHVDLTPTWAGPGGSVATRPGEARGMKVFLSYRRDDTGGRSGRLFDSLADALGARNVFQDVATLAPGRDFADQVAAAIAASDAVLVVIGPGWFGAAAGAPGRRLDRPDDPVRQEVAQALASEIPVVPVLVDGATLPGETELPADLVALTRRQAVTLSDDSWRADVGELLRRLKGEPPPGGRRRRAVAVGVGVGALVLAGIVIAAAVRDDGGSSDSRRRCARPTTRGTSGRSSTTRGHR